MNKKQISITLGIMCFILTVAICIQLKTIENTTTTVSQSLKENGLRDEVLKWKEKYQIQPENILGCYNYEHKTEITAKIQDGRSEITCKNLSNKYKLWENPLQCSFCWDS